MDMKDMKLYVDDRPDEGVFRLHRDIFADPQLFELEQKYIFERTWVFLALDSQLPKPHDFITTSIGRMSVLVARNAKGKIGAFLNVCRHKGTTLSRVESGNAKYHVCNYHGWAYDSAGKNVDIKDRKSGCYTPAFDAEDHNLVPLARLESYRGLLFGSLDPNVPPLEEFLGDMRFFIDLAMLQGPQGMEFVPGRITYTYDANWKLQMDNGIDQYHLTSTHTSFMQVQERRRAGEGNLEARQFDWAKRFSQEGGIFTFPHGHAAIWLNQPEVSKRPVYPTIDEVRSRVGDTIADWMLKLRNTVIFPNMQIADSTSLLLRVFRPLAVDKTEMRVFCLAPIGEAPEVRAWRLRQFEDFFNVSGFATPDDTVVYEDSQIGFQASPLEWLQGHARGMGAVQQGASELATQLGIAPAQSLQGQFDMQAEACFHAPYREWARLMQAGVSGKRPYDE
jgi:benzoate/toluate 1,2-dioxygenase alpha subunit